MSPAGAGLIRFEPDRVELADAGLPSSSVAPIEVLPTVYLCGLDVVVSSSVSPTEVLPTAVLPTACLVGLDVLVALVVLADPVLLELVRHRVPSFDRFPRFAVHFY